MNKRDVLQAAHIALPFPWACRYGDQGPRQADTGDRICARVPGGSGPPVSDDAADIEACRKQTFNAKERPGWRNIVVAGPGISWAVSAGCGGKSTGIYAGLLGPMICA